MTTGSRAVWLAVLVVVFGAVLAWLLSDGGVFTTATSSSVLGKFGYDAVRDFPKTTRPLPDVSLDIPMGSANVEDV